MVLWVKHVQEEPNPFVQMGLPRAAGGKRDAPTVESQNMRLLVLCWAMSSLSTAFPTKANVMAEGTVVGPLWDASAILWHTRCAGDEEPQRETFCRFFCTGVVRAAAAWRPLVASVAGASPSSGSPQYVILFSKRQLDGRDSQEEPVAYLHDVKLGRRSSCGLTLQRWCALPAGSEQTRCPPPF